MQMYKYTDKVIRYMNRRTIALFHKSDKLIRQDELNVIEGSKKLYDDLNHEAVEGLLRVAKEAYKNAYKNGLIILDKEQKPSNHIVGKAWLLSHLNDYNPVTGYVFSKEVSRKRARFAESVIAQRSQKDFKDAIRFWALMVAQYAIDITDSATEQGYKDAGVKYVKWNTEKDDRVCKVCRERDGKIYKIGEVPDKPHWHCRCYLTPVAHK